MVHSLYNRGLSFAPTKEEVAVQTSRLKAPMIAVALLAASVVLGSFTDDADAERRTQLKILWAVVNANCDLARGKGVTDSSKVDAGDYEIKFRQDVSRCAYSATFDHTSGFFFISLRDSSIGPREVGVTTTDRAAVVHDSPYHLIMQC